MLTQRWRTEVGLGYATPLVVGDRLYVFSRRGDNEVMSALDAATGKTIWDNQYPVSFTMNKGAARHGQGPKSTPAYADGKLFAIGMTGVITAYDARTASRSCENRARIWCRCSPPTRFRRLSIAGW